jgi:Arc/MetJ-type ribon-helix-helix transcriptional regulator
MTHSEYIREGQRLREVLKDAMDRGDYHLEMDVKEALEKLRDEYNKEDDNEDHL